MASVYTHRNFYTDSFTHREAFKHSKLLHRKSFTHSKLSHTASVYTQNTCTQCFYTWRALTHTASFLKQISFCTQKSFYTQQAFTQRSFYTQQAFTHSKHLHTEHLHTVLLHMASVYTHRNFYTDSFTHREAFKHSKLLQTKAFTHSKLLQKKNYTEKQQELQLQNRISAPKRKKMILKHFLEGLLKWKLLAPAAHIAKICWQITFAALMQPLQYDSRDPAAQDNSITHAAAAPSNLDAGNRRTHEVPFIAGCSHLTRKNATSCSHYNAFRSIP